MKFSDLAPLDIVNTAQYEADPVLSADGLILYFAREGNIWRSSRGGAEQPFGIPELAEKLGISSGASSESKISFSADSLVIYLSSVRDGGLSGGADIWWASRDDLSSKFGVAHLLENVSGDGDDYDPHISTDGLRLYHAPSAGGVQDIVVSTRGVDKVPFGAPVALAVINSDETDADPALSADELVIVFSSTRTGDRELYMATRSSIDEPFDAPEALSTINSPVTDGDPFLAETQLGCELFFTSTRAGGEGSHDIYRVEITGS